MQRLAYTGAQRLAYDVAYSGLPTMHKQRLATALRCQLHRLQRMLLVQPRSKYSTHTYHVSLKVYSSGRVLPERGV